jgi:hypothetical protein
MAPLLLLPPPPPRLRLQAPNSAPWATRTPLVVRLRLLPHEGEEAEVDAVDLEAEAVAQQLVVVVVDVAVVATITITITEGAAVAALPFQRWPFPPKRLISKKHWNDSTKTSCKKKWQRQEKPRLLPKLLPRRRTNKTISSMKYLARRWNECRTAAAAGMRANDVDVRRRSVERMWRRLVALQDAGVDAVVDTMAEAVATEVGAEGEVLLLVGLGEDAAVARNNSRERSKSKRHKWIWGVYLRVTFRRGQSGLHVLLGFLVVGMRWVGWCGITLVVEVRSLSENEISKT